MTGKIFRHQRKPCSDRSKKTAAGEAVGIDVLVADQAKPMTIECLDADERTVRPAEEVLWRGVTMLRYDKGRWHRQSKPTQAVVSFRNDRRALYISIHIHTQNGVFS